MSVPDFLGLMDAELAAQLTLPMAFATSRAELDESRVRSRAATDYEGSGDVTHVDHVVGASPDVLARVYRPVHIAGQLPCIVAMHGGGFVGGSYESLDSLFDRWCPALSCTAVSVQYRLAPETCYPGPLEDCHAALLWVQRNANELGIDADRIGLLGISAGGGLAAALAMLVRDRRELRLAFQLLMYPMLDDRQTTESSQWDVPVWSSAANRFGWHSYLGDLSGSDDVPAYAAPARATDLSGLPPTFLGVGALDIFCDEDIRYAQRLLQAGVPTELHVYPGAPHGFDRLAPDAEISRRCERDQREWLARQCAGTPGA